MSDINKDWPIVEKLPSKLHKNLFVAEFVEVKEVVDSKDSKGLLIAQPKQESAHKYSVVLKGPTCIFVELGDDVMLKQALIPQSLFVVDGKPYGLFSENDVNGAW